MGSQTEVLNLPPRGWLARSLPRRREIVAVIDPVWAAPDGDATESVRASAELVRAAARPVRLQEMAYDHPDAEDHSPEVPSPVLAQSRS